MAHREVLGCWARELRSSDLVFSFLCSTDMRCRTHRAVPSVVYGARYLVLVTCNRLGSRLRPPACASRNIPDSSSYTDCLVPRGPCMGTRGGRGRPDQLSTCTDTRQFQKEKRKGKKNCQGDNTIDRTKSKRNPRPANLAPNQDAAEVPPAVSVQRPVYY